MSLNLICKCGKALRIKDELAGKRVRCPACGEVLVAPAVATPTPPAAVAKLTDNPSGTDSVAPSRQPPPGDIPAALPSSKPPAPAASRRQDRRRPESLPWEEGTARQVATGERLEEWLEQKLHKPVRVVAFEEATSGSLALAIILTIVLLPVILVLVGLLAIPGLVYMLYAMIVEWPEARRSGVQPARYLIAYLVFLVLGPGFLFAGSFLMAALLPVLWRPFFGRMILARTEEDYVLIFLNRSLFNIPMFGRYETFPADIADVEVLASRPARTVLRFETPTGERVLTVQRSTWVGMPPEAVITDNLEFLSGEKKAPAVKRLASLPGGPDRTPSQPRPILRYLAIGAGSLMLFSLLCCGGMMFLGYSINQANKKEIAEANQLWDADHKAEAVAKYKPVLLQYLSAVDAADRPVLFQRVIEYEVEQGQTSSAKQLITKALNNKVDLAFHSPKAQELLAEDQRERGLAKRPAEQTGSQQASVVVIARQLYANYLADENGADQRYKGKALEITGKVIHIDRKAARISLDGGGPRLGGGQKEVRCFFRPASVEQLDGLQVGQSIKLRGRCMGKLLFSVVVEDCSRAS